jgi:pentatricopeptide repeat protein
MLGDTEGCIMQVRGLAPNVITYSAVISACEKGQQPERVLQLLDEMQVRGPTPNEITYSATISDCVKGQQSVRALVLRANELIVI